MDNLNQKEIINTVKYSPAVSIIFPFKAKIALKAELQHKLNTVIDTVKKKLHNTYPQYQCSLVLSKLQNIKETIDYSSVKSGLAIYVSPLLTKLYYLDIPVEEKIVVNESFEVRDIVYNKQAEQQYIVLVLNNKEAKAYLGIGSRLIPIEFHIPNHIAAYINEEPERVANFSEPSDRKEIMLDKFLHHIDNELSDILKEHPLPVFVLGTDRTVGHFKKESRHLKKIAGIINGNYINSPTDEITTALQKSLKNLNEKQTQTLLEELNDAIHKNKVAIGIHAVWRAAGEKMGRLLLVEKNYTYPAELTDDKNSIRAYDETSANQLHIMDAVDDVIENVLKYGGEVAFVEKGILSEYEQIALIQYY